MALTCGYDDVSITMPITCMECEYDLTGTPRSSRCPECGMSAEASYHRAESLPSRRSLHPIALFTLVMCAIGVVMSLVPLTSAEVDNVVGLVFCGGFLLWSASPFIAVGAMAVWWGSSTFKSITYLIASAVLLAWCGFYVADVQRSTSSTAALAYIFAPLYSWVWIIAVHAFLAFAAWVGHVREVG